MKKTLLALMLVSSLFVISCGADSTKPTDAYKSQPTETKTGTTTGTFSTSAGIVDVTSSYLLAGEKVTEIVQVTTTGTTGTTTTNTVTATTKNTDGGIYQFTINDTTFNGYATVTYKYAIKEAAPIVEKETTGTYVSSTSPLTIDNVNYNDAGNQFDKYVISVTDKYGIKLTYREYSYDNVNNTITVNKYYTDGDTFTVRYSYRDISMISEQPLTGAVTVTDATTSGTATVTIPLDAATYARRSYYIKAVITDTSTVTPTEPIYHNGIVPSTGTIDITSLVTTIIPSPSQTTTSGTYEIWVY